MLWAAWHKRTKLSFLCPVIKTPLSYKKLCSYWTEQEEKVTSFLTCVDMYWPLLSYYTVLIDYKSVIKQYNSYKAL